MAVLSVILLVLIVYFVLGSYARNGDSQPDIQGMPLDHSGGGNVVQQAYPWVDFTKIYPTLSVDEIDLLQRESFGISFVYAPFVQFEPVKVRGQFVNIEPGGYRRGCKGVQDQPWPPRGSDLTVFIYGGSTTFSYGLEDSKTVASFIERELSAALPDQVVQCYNFGRGYYFSTQERLLFENHLLEGYIPDCAVFIDGLNDFFFADGLPYFTKDLYQVTGAPEATTAKVDEQSVVQQLIIRYARNLQMVEAVAETNGVSVFFVGQPVPFLDYPRTPETYPFRHPAVGHELCAAHYAEFRNAALENTFGERFMWSGDVFSQATETMYADGIHYSRKGAEILARSIVTGMLEGGVVQPPRSP